MLGVRKVNFDEFSSVLGDSPFTRGHQSKEPYSYFLIGEKGGVIRDDALGTVEFVNLPEEELNDHEELELLMNICGEPGEFSEKLKVPSLKTIIDYQEEAKYIDRLSLLTWVAQISFILIPIALTVWLITFITG